MTDACAPSMVSTPSWPRSPDAATSSIEMLTVPASTIATPTSVRVAEINLRRCGPGGTTPNRSRVSAECR